MCKQWYIVLLFMINGSLWAMDKKEPFHSFDYDLGNAHFSLVEDDCVKLGVNFAYVIKAFRSYVQELFDRKKGKNIYRYLLDDTNHLGTSLCEWKSIGYVTYKRHTYFVSKRIARLNQDDQRSYKFMREDE
jgi:hypothetical protein